MPVDKAELAKDLDTPEYQEIVKTELAKKEFVIQTKDEHTTFLDNYKKDVVEKEIPLKIKEVHDKYDQDIKTLFGMERNQDEKSYDFLKRAAKTKLDTLSGEIKDLNEKIKKGDSSGVLAKKLEEAEAQFQATLKEKEEMITGLKSSQEQAARSAALQEAYSGVRSKFKKDLPPMFAQTEKFLLGEIMKEAVLKDGKLYQGDGSGGIKKDKNFNPIEITAVLEESFKDVIDTQRKAGGAGSGSGDPNPVDPLTITAETVEIPANIKNQDALMSHLIELGIPRGTKNFNEIWNKYSKGLPLS